MLTTRIPAKSIGPTTNIIKIIIIHHHRHQQQKQAFSGGRPEYTPAALTHQALDPSPNAWEESNLAGKGGKACELESHLPALCPQSCGVCSNIDVKKPPEYKTEQIGRAHV